MAKSLLLADDSVTIHKMVELCFTQENVAVVAARGVDEALARARENNPDVILADTFMPGRNGYDLAEAVRADPGLSHVPVVLLASPSEPFDEGRAQAAGVVGWIAKPFQSAALLEQVKKAFAAKPLTTQPAPVRPMPAAPTPVEPTPAPTPAPIIEQRIPTEVPPVRVMPSGSPTAISPAVRPPTMPPLPPDVTIPPALRAASVAEPRSVPPIVEVVPSPPAVPPRAVVPQRPGSVAAGRSRMPPRPPVSGPKATLNAQNHEALLREAISTASREMIEKIAWEVVPELAETLIKEELERLMKQRQGG